MTGFVCSAGSVLHAFPNPVVYKERFNIWVKNAGVVGKNNDYIFKNCRICRKHFEPIYHYPKNRLSVLAIPTLHVPGKFYFNSILIILIAYK